MRAILVAVASALALSGCSTLQNIGTDIGLVQNASVSSQLATAAETSFDTAEVIGTGYLSLPVCGPGVAATCQTKVIAQEIYNALKSGRTARDAVQALVVQANGGSIPIASYNTLQAAITSINALTKATGAGA